MPLLPTDNLIASRESTNYRVPISQFDARYEQIGGNLSAVSLNGGNLAGLRNKIINGNFIVDQLNFGNPTTVSASTERITVDGWTVAPLGGPVTCQAIANTAQPRQNLYRISGAAGNTFVNLYQRIESLNCVDIAGQQVTLSFTTANTTRPSIRWRLVYPNVENSYTSGFVEFANGVVSTNSTFTRRSVTLTLPAACSNGIQVMFESTSQTSGNWTIGDIQLEVGPYSTSFERRPISIEEILCKRYFQWAPMTLIGTATGGSQSMQTSIMFPVTMRITPTVGSARTDPRMVGSPQTSNISSFGINRLTIDYACPFIQSSGAGEFFVTGYMFPLSADIL